MWNFSQKLTFIVLAKIRLVMVFFGRIYYLKINQSKPKLCEKAFWTFYLLNLIIKVTYKNI
jgi:hypothetical protein